MCKQKTKCCTWLAIITLISLMLILHSLTAAFNDTIYSYGLIPLITRPTRVTETSATLIDNIFTNKSISCGKSMYGILVSDISDHYPVFCVETILKGKSIVVPFLKRDFSEKKK